MIDIGGMAARIGAPVTTLALCWRLARADGVTIGFTAHDRDLVIGGLVYRAAPGMLPSAVVLGESLDVDAMDVSGALSDDAIRGDDLAAGRWDGAALRLFAVDWTAPEAGSVPLARGELGDVTVRDAGFTAELRSAAALLDRPAVELTSPECRAELGDRRCRVDLAPRTRLTRVTAVVDAATVEVAEAAAGTDAYAYGRLRWIEGANSGLGSAILGSAGTRLSLREPPPFATAAGVLVEIVEGCDKRLESCSARFANVANFRGEPHLPGNDLLTRYPGG